MATYIVNVVGSISVGSDNTIVQIQPPTNATIKIKRIRFHFGDGTQSSTEDMYALLQCLYNSIGATNGNIVTPLQADRNMPAARSVVTTLATPATPGQLAEQISIQSNTEFHWQAKDEDDKYIIRPNRYFAISVNPTNQNLVNTTPLPLDIPMIPHFMIQQSQISTIQTVIAGGRLFG